jgi:hypothetical protein
LFTDLVRNRRGHGSTKPIGIIGIGFRAAAMRARHVRAGDFGDYATGIVGMEG